MQNASERADVAIIGAGPVGLFTIFECGMLNMRCCLFDALAVPGGQCAALYPEKPIYDIPGYPRIAAAELIAQLVEQAAPFAPDYRLGSRVARLVASEEGFLVENAQGVRVAVRAVVIAAGAGAFGPNRPPLAGLEDFEGRSVFYLVERREEFRGRRIVIAGGGDSAVDWALSLAEIAERVTLVHRRAKFRAAPQSVERLHEMARSGRVEILTPFQLSAIEGREGALETVVVADLDGGTRRIAADRLLALFGLATDLGPLAAWDLALDRDRIAVDPATCATSRPGIFAIGDIAAYPGKLKLILSGFAEAALAAHAIHPLVHRGRPLHFEYSTMKGVPGR